MIPTQLDLIVFTIFTPSWALVSQQTPPNYLSFTNTNPPTKLLENRINGSKIILILNVYVILMMTSVAQSHIFALSVSPTQLFYPKTRHWHQFNHRFLKAIFKTSGEFRSNVKLIATADILLGWHCEYMLMNWCHSFNRMFSTKLEFCINIALFEYLLVTIVRRIVLTYYPDLF